MTLPLPFDVRGGIKTIPGLSYLGDWLTGSEERHLLAHIDAAPWLTSMSRRVQHYGWRYDYKARRVSATDRIGPLPGWLRTLAQRLTDTNVMAMPDQAIVNEYRPGQGIAAHADCVPCFGPVVAMASLGSPVQMDFSGTPSDVVVPLLLEPRSLLVLADTARFNWRHGIPKRRTDPRFGVTRTRRISVTFRTVIQST